MFQNGINGHYEIALSVTKHEDVDLVYENIISKGAESVMIGDREHVILQILRAALLRLTHLTNKFQFKVE